MIHKTHNSHLSSTTLMTLSAALCLSACGGSGSSSGGTSLGGVRSTSHSVAGTAEIAVSGRFLAYVADEATTGAGEFLNGDNDKTDGVVSLVNMATFTDTNLGVAVRDLEWATTVLFMAVNEEEDQVDWDGDGGMGAGELSLLYWQDGVTVQPEFVASMDPSGPC
jgi:hypothetical protein